MSVPFVLARAGAVATFLNMALHTSATPQIMRSAKAASPEMGGLVPLLWLLYSAALLILGILVWLHARPGAAQRSPVMFLSAFFLTATAVGQYVVFGFILPEVTVLIAAALLVASTFTSERTATAAA